MKTSLTVLGALVLTAPLLVMGAAGICAEDRKSLVDLNAKAEPADLELAALDILARQDGEQLKALTEKIASLNVAKRQALPVRVRAAAMEFRFRGEFPGPAIANVEYVVSKAGDKDHETLLAVKPDELKRLHQLRDALNKLVQNNYAVRLDVRMVWSEGGQAHSEDLEDILSLATAADRTAFARELMINDSGLGAFNLVHDPSVLPSKALPAEVHISVRASR